MSAQLISTEGPEQLLDAQSFISTKIDGCVKFRTEENDELASKKPMSVPGLLEKAAQEAPDVVALAVKREEKWIKWTYKEYLQGIFSHFFM